MAKHTYPDLLPAVTRAWCGRVDVQHKAAVQQKAQKAAVQQKAAAQQKAAVQHGIMSSSILVRLLASGVSTTTSSTSTLASDGLMASKAAGKRFAFNELPCSCSMRRSKSAHTCKVCSDLGRVDECAAVHTVGLQGTTSLLTHSSSVVSVWSLGTGVVCCLLCSLRCGALCRAPPSLVEPPVLCFAHCASCFPAGIQCCFPARTLRQAGKQIVTCLPYV